MEDKDLSEFSWSGLFFVTSVCSFTFSGIIKLLDGGVPILFLVLGAMSFLLFVINSLARVLARATVRRKKPRRKLAS